MTISEQNKREADPQIIFLQPVCPLVGYEGRTWAEDADCFCEDCDDCEKKPPKYIRSDCVDNLLQSKTDEIDALKAQVKALRNTLQDLLADVCGYGRECPAQEKVLFSTPEQCLADVVKKAREKALTDVLELKIPFPSWIKDPCTHEIFEFGLDAKNEAIQSLKGK